nr:hypothetical protein [Kibdelosporangium sp. MJ126-NF4]CEL14225.1 hypothetical protein [Kibdelosporangium sp. MJ126-NF4]CTQ88593.1 hypothetical protein [Kibdelosporangium sp. MJ126-NF4]
MRIIGATALLVVVALVSGCSAKTGDSGGGSNGGGSPAREVNKSLTLAQDDGSATVTLASVVESHKADSGYNQKPASGNFIAVAMKFDHKAGEYSVNSLYFKVREAGGKIVGTLDGNAMFALPEGKSLASGALTTGKSMSGSMVFDAKYTADAALIAVDIHGLVLGQWPLSGGEPIVGDGSPRKAINKSFTHKLIDDSAVVTLLSVAESKGGVERLSVPTSGSFVVLEFRFDGKTGSYLPNENYLKLKKPNGTMVEPGAGNGRYGVPTAETFGSDEITPGKAVTGKIAFDVKLEPGTKIVLSDVSEKTVGEWAL